MLKHINLKIVTMQVILLSLYRVPTSTLRVGAVFIYMF